MPIKVVPKILSSDEYAHRKKGYQRAHRFANKKEIEEFGQKQFVYLNKIVQKLPIGHWAATHTPKLGNIHISQEFLDLVPKNKQKLIIRQLKIHENIEHKEMNKHT